MTVAQRDKLIRREREILDRAREDDNRPLTEAERRELDDIDTKIRQHGMGRARTLMDTEGDRTSGHLRQYDDAQEVRALHDDESVRDYLENRGDLDADPAFEGIGFGRYVRSMVMGPQSDAERRALSEGTDSAGGYTVPSVLAAQLIDNLRARNTVIRAGARTVPLTSDEHSFARVAADPTPAWRAENATVSETDSTFDRVLFQPKSLAFIVRASREVLDDSVNLNTSLPGIFGQAMAAELDRVALFGSGSDPEPEGVANATGISAELMGQTAISDYTPLLDIRQSILEANAEEPTAAIMAPRTGRAFAGLADTTGQPLQRPPALDGMRFFETSKVPTNEGTGTNEASIVVGGFRSMWIGIRTDVRIELLKERYADNLQYGFLVWARYDIQLEQPGPFGLISQIVP